MMFTSRICGFFAVVLCSISAGLAQQNGGSYTCDPRSWTDGKKFTVTFRINRGKYPSQCTGAPGRVRFESSPDGKVYNTHCTVIDDIQTNCSFAPGTLGCGCTDSDDGGYYDTEYNFIAGPGKDRWWRANVGCLDGANAQALSFSGSCGINPPPPEGGSYECKSSRGDVGEPISKITFRIDRSKYPVLCTKSTTGQPQFHSSPADGTFTTKCTVDVDIRTNGSCSFTPGTLGCGCTESDDDGYYNIEYNSIWNFKNETIWIATISCLDANTLNPALTFSGDCKIPGLPQADVECGFCDLNCGYIGEPEGCIALIVVICIVCAVVTLIVVRICYRCCRNQIKKHLTCTRFFRGVDYVICCGCCDPCCHSNCGLGDTAPPSERDETCLPDTRSRVVPKPSAEEGSYNMTVVGTPRSLPPLHNQVNATPASPRKESLSDSKKQKLPSIKIQ